MQEKPCRILVIETSSRVGSVALATDRGQPQKEGPRDRLSLVATAQLSGTMKHAGELVPAIDMLLRKQGWSAEAISDVFVSVGPGSFTGLRIGVTLARTLGWALGARIVAVPTVDCLARNALAADPPPKNLAVVLDAKRSQIYTAGFELHAGLYRKIVDARLADPREFLARCPRPLAVLGEGIPYHRQAIEDSGADVLDISLWPPKAENVFHVGLELAKADRFTNSSQLIPLYIRRPEAEEKWGKLHPSKV